MYSYSHYSTLHLIAIHDLCIWETKCLSLRTRNGGLKNSFIPGGTLPTHPVTPNKVDM